MTVERTYEPIKQVSNGSVKNFSFDFSFENENEIVVYYDRTADFKNKIVISSSQYNVTYSSSGGIIQFSVAPEAGYIQIERKTIIEQPVSYKTTSGFDALVIEESFDKLTRIDQEIRSELFQKANVTDTYKKEEIDDSFATKEDINILKTKTDSLETQILDARSRLLPLEIKTAQLDGRMNNLEEKVGNVNTVLDKINGEVI